MAGRAAAVLPAYRELTQRYPGILNLWFEMGTAAARELDFALANLAFDHAQSLAENNSAVLVMIGQQYHRLRQTDRARACFQRAVEVDPASVHARLSWAAWLERERRLDEANAQVDNCLAANSSEPSARYYRAFLFQRLGKNEEAEKILRDLVSGTFPDPNLSVSCFHLLAVVLDELGQYEEALQWLLKAKSLIRKQNQIAEMEASYDKADRARRSLLSQLTGEMIQRWSREPPAVSLPRRLALLGGHPRSGTTLIEQILAAHPAIDAFDESEAFVSEVGDKLAPPPPAPPLSARGLDALSPERVLELRRRYFKSLLRETHEKPDAELLLDKNPAPTASLHLWLRVFPESKVLIALRDPRDVVISCFFQNFSLTPLNANFLSLERSVKHYTDLMDTWLRLRDLGGFQWMETRYEDVVARLETDSRRITEFLGLLWQASQSEFHEAARRKLVFSPTYSDVARPIHHRAIGRWRNYAAALEPFLPRLDRFVKAFGYAD